MSTNPIDKRIGARLRHVRESLGLTLQTASEIVGFNTYQTLGSIEKGTRPAKASELAKLCDHYCKDSWYFLREDEPTEPPIVCAWRDVQDSAMRPLVEAQVHRFAKDFWLLEVITGEQHPPGLVPWERSEDALSYESVSSKADDVVSDLNLGARPSGTLRQVLEEEWYIKILCHNLAGAGSALVADSEFGHIIAIDAQEVPWRQNFSLGHELFHLLAKNYYPLESSQNETSVGKPKYEKLADAFSSALLMPRIAVLSELKKRTVENRIAWVDLIGIATEFGVSRDALLWRLVNLGKLKAADVKGIKGSDEFKNMDKEARYSRRADVQDFSKRFVRLGVKALQLGKISKGRFCQMCGIKRTQFDSFVSEYGDLQYSETALGSESGEMELASPNDASDQ